MTVEIVPTVVDELAERFSPGRFAPSTVGRYTLTASLHAVARGEDSNFSRGHRRMTSSDGKSR
jgi:hypothetical protein